MVGGIVAGFVAVPLYGAHAMWLDKLFPWSHHHEHNDYEADGSIKVSSECLKTLQSSSPRAACACVQCIAFLLA